MFWGCFFFFFGHDMCGILASRPGFEPSPPALEGEVLTTGQPGKSPDFLSFVYSLISWTLPMPRTRGLYILDQQIHSYGNRGSGVGNSTYKNTKHPSPQLSMGFSRQEYTISFSRGSSRPRDWTHVSYVSCVAGGFFTCWATEEALPQCMDPPNCWAERKHPIQLLILWTKDPG